eukprot:3545517-Pyramimonas_sp.AAC.1
MRLAARLVATTELGKKYLTINCSAIAPDPQVSITDIGDYESYNRSLNIAWAERQQKHAADRLQRHQRHQA